MRPQHSANVHRLWAAVLLGGGILLACIAVWQVTNFYNTLHLAQDFHNAPACLEPRQTNCIATVNATVTNAYTTRGSKGATYYHVVVSANDPSIYPGNFDDIGYSDYLAMPIAAAVTATSWRGAVMGVYVGNGDFINSAGNPLEEMRVATFGLIIPAFAVGMLFSGVWVALSLKTPDDILRDATYGVPQPPRMQPTGLLIAIMAWSTARAMLIYAVILLVECAVFTSIASHGSPLSISYAPFVVCVTVIAVSLVYYLLRYAEFNRYIAEGVVKDLPITREKIIRGRGGPIGAKVWYSLDNGRQAKRTIRNRWWSVLHEGMRLHAIVSPTSGKIWRVLGATDDAGRPVY